MSGEFRKKVSVEKYDATVALGTYREDNTLYSVRVIEKESKSGVYVGVESSRKGKYSHITRYRPCLSGEGVNESLALSSQKAELPEEDKDIEAYARLALQPSDEEIYLDYSGPLWKDMLE